MHVPAARHERRRAAGTPVQGRVYETTRSVARGQFTQRISANVRLAARSTWSMRSTLQTTRPSTSAFVNGADAHPDTSTTMPTTSGGSRVFMTRPPFVRIIGSATGGGKRGWVNGREAGPRV